MTPDHSRPRLLAAGVSAFSSGDLERRLEDTLVVICADTEVPLWSLCIQTIVSTLRRGPGRLAVLKGQIPEASIISLVEGARAIDPARPIDVVTSIPPDATAVITVGDSGPGIRVVPDGYGARLASEGGTGLRMSRHPNPLGAVYAAALAATEAFKHTAAVRPERRVWHRELQFCPVSLSEDLDRVPDLPQIAPLSLTLVGVGAIGTGIVLLLDVLSLEGELLAADPQAYAEENMATYSLGEFRDVTEGTPKVELAKRSLTGFAVELFWGDARSLIDAIDAGHRPWHPTVLNAVDTAEARRDVQRLWPDRLIDGATGDTMLGIHDYERGGRCMECVFPIDRGGPSAAERLASLTGLPLERAAAGDTEVTRDDVEHAPPEKRDFLRAHVGEPVCGLADAVGLTDVTSGGFRPSVPFVSLQAACLSVGRLLAQEIGVADLPNFVQYDALIGPHRGTYELMKPRRGCYCQERSENITELRRRRASKSETRSSS